MVEQEIEQEKQLNKIDDTSREINPYQELIVNNREKKEPLIFSNVLNYVQHSRFHSMNQHIRY